jgi:hypothetical protein
MDSAKARKKLRRMQNTTVHATKVEKYTNLLRGTQNT